MWELVATAVAGLNAGAGLQAALAGPPSASGDATAFQTFAGRSRMLGLLLSTVSTVSCVQAYYGESRGALWLAAAAGVGIGIPFNLLLMSPPAMVVTAEPPRVRFAPEAGSPAGAADAAEEMAAAGAGAGVAAGEDASVGSSAFEGAAATPLSPRAGVLSSATVAPAEQPRRRRLMYSKSGMLISPAELASSWSKRYWFSSALSLTAFGCMMALVGTGKDAATYGYAPY